MLPIISVSSCSSKFVIYLIFCKYCKFFYIGQSKDIKSRILRYIYDIKSFVKFSERNTSVSIHFNLKNHCYSNHFNFFIYKTDKDNLDERLYLESFLINLCKNL